MQFEIYDQWCIYHHILWNSELYEPATIHLFVLQLDKGEFYFSRNKIEFEYWKIYETKSKEIILIPITCYSRYIFLYFQFQGHKSIWHFLLSGHKRDMFPEHIQRWWFLCFEQHPVGKPRLTLIDSALFSPWKKRITKFQISWLFVIHCVLSDNQKIYMAFHSILKVQAKLPPTQATSKSPPWVWVIHDFYLISTIIDLFHLH